MTSQSGTRAILLLNAILENDSKSAARPLSFQEYGTFAAWLKDQGKRPDDLLKLDPAKPNFVTSPIDQKRLPHAPPQMIGTPSLRAASATASASGK